MTRIVGFLIWLIEDHSEDYEVANAAASCRCLLFVVNMSIAFLFLTLQPHTPTSSVVQCPVSFAAMRKHAQAGAVVLRLLGAAIVVHRLLGKDDGSEQVIAVNSER